MNDTKPSIREIIGNPKQIDMELEAFRTSTRLLSSRRAKLISQYAKKWIAILDGKVQASAVSLPALLSAIDTIGLSRENAVIRYIDRAQRRMIL